MASQAIKAAEIESLPEVQAMSSPGAGVGVKRASESRSGKAAADNHKKKQKK